MLEKPGLGYNFTQREYGSRGLLSFVLHLPRPAALAFSYLSSAPH